jgi:hypothetical protein
MHEGRTTNDPSGHRFIKRRDAPNAAYSNDLLNIEENRTSVDPALRIDPHEIPSEFRLSRRDPGARRVAFLQFASPSR